MRTSDADILILAAPEASGPGHWASRWGERLATARRVEAAGADRGAAALLDAVRTATRPVVIVAHDDGVLAVAAAGASLAGTGVVGAFLVAPPIPPTAAEVAAPLPFPALLVASRDDPGAPYAASEALAAALGAELVDAGPSGHLDEASGHGPWPEGLMRFAGFLKQLGTPAARAGGTAETHR